HADFHIVAVADPDPRRCALAETAIPGVRTYADAATLLQHERLDFVDIAAPPALHAPLITAAAAAGVHVLCEKPLMVGQAEYQAVRRAVRRAGTVLYTVHNWKYSDAFAAVRQWLADGSLGALRSISFETTRDGCAVAAGDNWRVRAAVAGGGILTDH